MAKAKKKKKVKPDQLEEAVTALIADYMVELRAANERDVKAAGRVSRDKLRHETPADAPQYRDWGEYQQGWQMSTKKTAYGDVTVTIKNKAKPGLTHLLEEGHVMANGKSSKAYPHIKPAGEDGVEELRRRIKK